MNKKQQELFDKNKGLVYKCIKDLHIDKNQFEDAVQEGMLGLWLASGGFDETKGYTFGTYAYKYIYNYVKKNLRKNQWLKPNKQFYQLKKEISDLADKKDILFEEALDIIFQDKHLGEKSKFVAVLSDNVPYNDELNGATVPVKDGLEMLDYQTAMNKLKKNNYHVWYVIHEYYLMNRPQNHIAKELDVSIYRIKKMRELGLNELRKYMTL